MKPKILVSFFLLLLTPPRLIAQTADIPWPMAGANPERTSWTPETLSDQISTQWVKPISPYIPQKVQVIGAEGKVFVSTSAGLYAFNAATGQDIWKYPTSLPLGHSPTYANGYLYVGGLDKKIHKIRAADGQGIWTFNADGGFVSNPVVVNGKIYATCRDGNLYAINDTNPPTLAWKFSTGNQINLSPAYKDNVLYIASNDGYGYAVNASSGAQIWQSDADPSTPAKDKFPSQGFHSWWPVIYGEDVIFTKTGFYAANGVESSWLFGPAPNTSLFAGNVGYENQSGYWPVGEKIVDIRTNPNGNSIPDYFETQESGDSRPQHGPFRRNIFFVNRNTGLERQFDLDADGRTDAAPMMWVGDGGTHYPPIVSRKNNVLYFDSVIRARGTSFNALSIVGWKVNTPFVSITMDGYRSSDEPMGISAAGDKLYYNHCCDREIRGVNISRPNTDNPAEPAREWSYISGGGLSFFSWPLAVNGLPNTSTNYYYQEAVKYFWDPQPALDPPCCPAVFWNENDKVGPAAYQGRLYVIMGNALIALGPGGAGTNAPRLAAAAAVPPPPLVPSATETQIKIRLEQEVQKIVQSGHLKPSFLHGGNITLGSYSRVIDDYLNHYWHNPADIHLVLLRALPFLSPDLQSRVKAYLQVEFAAYNPSTYAHTGFGEGQPRDPWPYPPLETTYRLFNLPQTKQLGSAFDSTWGFPPANIYAIWKYSAAGLGDPSTLLSQWGSRLQAPITANNPNLTDEFLANRPLVANAYIAAYQGYVELSKLAGRSLTVYQPFQTELNRLLVLRKTQLTTFPNSQNSVNSSYRSYYPSMITYYNFAYLTPELADYLRLNARSADPGRDILAILQKYQQLAPYWLQVHNGETQGESVIQPYQQTHSLFQALARVKKASRSELISYLDTPIVPVGDLYYIDNLAAILEAPADGTSPALPSPTPASIPGDANGDSRVDGLDFIIWNNNYLHPVTTGASAADFNLDRRVDGSDYVIWLSNYVR